MSEKGQVGFGEKSGEIKKDCSAAMPANSIGALATEAMMSKRNAINFAFRRPRFPLICDLDGFLVAAGSPAALQRSLSLAGVDLPTERKVRIVDANGESWMILPNEMIVAPRFATRRWRKIEIIRLFNERRNAKEAGRRYPEHGIANKRLDAIVGEIAAILIREGKMQGKKREVVFQRSDAIGVRQEPTRDVEIEQRRGTQGSRA